MINEITANPIPISNMQARSWDRSGKRHGNPEKSEKELGFKAKISLPDGLEKTVTWTRENMSLILSCMQKHLRHVPDIKHFL